MNRNRKKLEGRPEFRRFLRVQDITLGAAVVILCLFLLPRLLQRGEPGGTAVVFLDSAEIMALPLREDDDYRIDLMPEYGVPVSLEVKGGGIRYVDVTCPDHICEKTGIISAEGQTAVCMPNGVAVVIR